MTSLKTAEKEFLTLYVLRLPVEGLPAVEEAEAFVVPIMERENGVLLAIPVGFIPDEWIQQGLEATEDSPFGPSLEIVVQSMEEDEAGQEVPLETSLNCLMMDFSWAIFPGLREFDPVTEGVGIQCFLEGSPHLVPFSSALLSQAYAWMMREGAPVRAQFYSADEGKEKPPGLAAKGKSKPAPPSKGDPPSKQKKPTTAALAEQIAMLSQSIPEMASQLKALQEQQMRFEGSFATSQEALRTPAHRLPFQATPSQGPADLMDFAKKIGPPPRTRPAAASVFNTPARTGIMAEDEERVDAQEMAAPFQGSIEDPSFGAALMQQSQAMNALVAHLSGQKDPMMDLGSGGGLSMSLSSKGTKGRERLMQELANKNGTFFLQVAQNAFKRLRPAETPPKAFADFPRKAFFSKYLERQGGFAGQRDLGLTMWLLSQVADAMLCQEPQHAQDLLALTLVTLEQVVQDNGKWELGFLLSLQEDPPASVFTAKVTSTNPRMRAFAPLCPQPWATVALSFLREMDVIATRRAEASSSSTRKTNPQQDEEERPAPKRRPKFPKKPKAQE